MATTLVRPSNGRWIGGVCAGLARTTGWDPTLVRIGALALTLFLLGPVMILFYLLVGAFAPAN